MKKTLKSTLIAAGVVSAVVAGGKLLKNDTVQEKLLPILGDDNLIKLNDTTNLLGDLLMWPVDFVHALLP